jgi:hypothetical protein
MKLSKDQIDIIDKYLKKAGIGHWDIRLEMTDHIASKLEAMEGHYDFEFALKGVLKDLGWTGNLKWLERERLLAINTITRTAYFKNVVSFLSQGKTLLWFLLGVSLYYAAYQLFSFNIFKWLSFILFSGPILYFTLHYMLTYFKIKKVGYLAYGYFYITFSMLLTNSILQIFKPDGLIEVSKTTSHNILFIITIINVLFIISGIKIYLKYYRQYQDLYFKFNTKSA